MTHAELVTLAAKWLRSHGYGTIIAERLPAGPEEPDAIGWKSGPGSSCLIECKASRADFLRDREKPHRKHLGLGMGLRRIYLAPPGLISPEELPERWGLAVATSRGVKLIVAPQDQIAHDRNREMELLLAYIRRVEGVSKRMRPKKRTTEARREETPHGEVGRVAGADLRRDGQGACDVDRLP